MADFTPMMRQYMDIKKQYPHCILFYRLGDFYEMFFEDAKIAAKELDIVLTGKNCGQEERAPMCGIPYHAADGYLSRLVEKGYKVAICEQMEDPKAAKGIVKREVIRIVTPGTNQDIQALDASKNNYIMSIAFINGTAGLAVCDVTTGDFFAAEIESLYKVMDEIAKFEPSEIICNEAFQESVNLDTLRENFHISAGVLESWYFDEAACMRSLTEHFHVSSMQGLGLPDNSPCVNAAGVLLQYLHETQKSSLEHISGLKWYTTSKYMFLDSHTRRNLELCETIREKEKKGSLLWVLDKTKTAMGARLMRQIVEQPLTDNEEIKKRLDAVDELKQNAICREEIREYLGPVYDLERLMSKISYKSANPRDFLALKSSLDMLPHIKSMLEDMRAPMLRAIYDELDTLEDVKELIGSAISEDAPLAMKEGGIIKKGYNETVDRLRDAKVQGKDWLASLEDEEREKTGIKNLKVSYNKVFGYYIEVTNSYKDQVPEYYMRKQTLANAERYIIPRLKELEDMILGAQDKLNALEYELYSQIRNSVAEKLIFIQKTAKAIAKTDVLCSLALVAERNRYVRPRINDEGIIDIKGGRHPVVEKMIPDDMFISNDTLLDENDNRILIITGPNMAGKSTYMRQSALIVLLAQIGSFVPADYADICITDRIFTRVGASDDLSSGQSTFMVEMTEVANILRNATGKSLLILDEIGRGTSTFDGLSIAWAVVEHISDKKKIGAKTLFATHYHELTELEGKIDGVSNYYIAVREKGDDIIFLRKIMRGGADKSYGIQVARLAGVPDSVTKRAKEIVKVLMNADITDRIRDVSMGDKIKISKSEFNDDTKSRQLTLFDTRGDEDTIDKDIIEELRQTDINNMTPLDAFNTICRLKDRLNKKADG